MLLVKLFTIQMTNATHSGRLFESSIQSFEEKKIPNLRLLCLFHLPQYLWDEIHQISLNVNVNKKKRYEKCWNENYATVYKSISFRKTIWIFAQF